MRSKTNCLDEGYNLSQIEVKLLENNFLEDYADLKNLPVPDIL